MLLTYLVSIGSGTLITPQKPFLKARIPLLSDLLTLIYAVYSWNPTNNAKVVQRQKNHSSSGFFLVMLDLHYRGVISRWSKRVVEWEEAVSAEDGRRSQ